MSEEILKALMQLFALITKQDGGIGDKEIAYVERFLVQQIGIESAQAYLQLYQETATEGEEKKLTSVLDSVKVLKLCKQISKTINQRQKVVVLVRILELINAEYNLTEQRLGIVKTVSDIFRIEKKEYESILAFVSSEKAEAFHDENHLVVSRKRPDPDDLPLTPEQRKVSARQYHLPGLDAPLIFLRIPSVGLYFLKYTGTQECLLNGLGVHQRRDLSFCLGKHPALAGGSAHPIQRHCFPVLVGFDQRQDHAGSGTTGIPVSGKGNRAG